MLIVIDLIDLCRDIHTYCIQEMCAIIWITKARKWSIGLENKYKQFDICLRFRDIVFPIKKYVTLFCFFIEMYGSLVLFLMNPVSSMWARGC